MAASMKHKPRAKSLWLLVRRLLCNKQKYRHPAAAAEEDGDKSSLLGRGSLEGLLESDGAGGGGAAVCRCTSQCFAEKEVLLPAAGQQRPAARTEALALSAAGGRGGAVMPHRRFMFGSFRRRLLMRRPWRPVLVAIPE